ncbi:unnamed protein product [Urochloa humidicola]
MEELADASLEFFKSPPLGLPEAADVVADEFVKYARPRFYFRVTRKVQVRRLTNRRFLPPSGLPGAAGVVADEFVKSARPRFYFRVSRKIQDSRYGASPTAISSSRSDSQRRPATSGRSWRCRESASLSTRRRPSLHMPREHGKAGSS